MKKNTYFYILMIVSMTFWGGSWTSGKIISQSASPEILIFWRFFITFISFVPVVLYLKVPLKLNKKGFIQVLIGAVCLAVYNFLFFIGLTVGLAGAGGVLVTTLNPLFTFLITAILFKQKFEWKHMIGLFVGCIGGFVLLEGWKFNSGQILMGGNLLFFFAAITWGFLSITSQTSKKNIHAFTFSFYTYGITALITLFLSIPKGLFSTHYMTTGFWINVIYISIGVTTFATTAYFFAVSNLGARRASSFIFLVPTSAMITSWLLLGEVPRLVTIIGGSLSLMAVYIMNTSYKIKFLKQKLV
ncbi:drug/metabolite transporter (DMT)-like permease [Natranaerovirga pectinivora]|uniref:Drug/metabolite transporter (DMT)-like permease n=1 Tax=Natranaerovirga pectinivora TaxID=682400 RepID=A0A4R3MMN1_9FIRM|nr:DMT family transporter [Natranaerovirga pectinivora]TCT16223.1 drug/metabolite transporter (DMT)-like permease [Natranaerovirga pectinivora]